MAHNPLHMILLVSLDELKNYKCRDKVPLQCEFCPSVFYRPKNLILRALKGTRVVSSCSIACRKKLLSRSLKHSYSNPRIPNTKRFKLKQELVNYLGSKCVVCGYNRSLSSLIFHHKSPSEKEFSICDGINRKFSKEKLLSELNKCVLLCSNCHGEHHDGLISIPL